MCGVTTIQVGNIVYEKLTNGSLVPVGEVSTNGQGMSHCSAPWRRRAAIRLTSGSYSQSEE